MARRTKAAEELEELLGASVPPGIAGLPAASVSALGEAVEAARHRQGRDMAIAFDGALKHVPWPLRGVVRKVVGG